MEIQSECLSYVPVEEIIDKIYGNEEHAKRKKSLANAALGVIASGSLVVHRIGLGLAKAQNLLGKHAVKQIDRLLSNTKLSVSDSFAYTVPYSIGARQEILTAMDWTDFDKDDQATLQISLITSHGRATPLLWMTVKKATLKNQRNDYEDALLTRFKEVLPPGVKITVLADRGFGDTKLYSFLKEKLGFEFVIRFRGNIKVTDNKGEMRTAAEWVSSNGRKKTLQQATLTAHRHEVAQVICVKAKGMKQAWCIAVSDPTLSANQVVNWYAKRWGIESQFRDTKDLHFGMGLSATKIGKCERRDRLLLISALAVIVLTLLGAAGENLGMDRYMKVNTVKHRTHSLFRQGCYYYGRMAKMDPEQLKQFLDEFLDLLVQHENLTALFWVI